jgi:RHS repeat-associated protein
LTIKKNQPTPSYTVLINRSASSGGVVNLRHPTEGNVSTNYSIIEVIKDKFGHIGLGDGCDDATKAPGQGSWLNIGPGCTQDTNRISLAWHVSLGRTFDGLATGQLALREAGLTRDSYTPYAIYYNAASTNLYAEQPLVAPYLTTNSDSTICINTFTNVVASVVLLTTNIPYLVTNSAGDVYTNYDSLLRQVKSCQTIVNILTPDTNQTVLKFYLSSKVGPEQNEVGLYTNFMEEPFVTWTIQNPEPATANKLNIIETRHGTNSTQSLEKSTDGGTVTWKLTLGSGPETRVETRQVSFTGGSLPTDRIELNMIYYVNSPGSPVYQCRETYHFYPWGSELVETLIPTANQLVTTYDYYDYINNPGDPYAYYGNGKLKQIAYPDGYWEKRIYEESSTFYDPYEDWWGCGYKKYAGALSYVLNPRPDVTASLSDVLTPANALCSSYAYWPGDPFNQIQTTFCQVENNTAYQDDQLTCHETGISDLGAEGPCDGDSVGKGDLGVDYGAGILWLYKYAANSPVGLAGHTMYEVQFSDRFHHHLYDHGTYDSAQSAFTLNPTNHLYTFDNYTNRYPDHQDTEFYHAAGFDSGGLIYLPRWWPDVTEGDCGYGDCYPDGLNDHPYSNLEEYQFPHYSRKLEHIYHSGSLTQNESYSYLGLINQWLLHYKTRYYNDSLGRATNVVIIDPVSTRLRTVYTADYRGGGGYDGPLLFSETDESGQTKNYSYDSLQRIKAMVIKGYGGQPDITNTFSYNANGQLLSQIEQSGTLSSSASWQYDLSGQTINTTSSSGGSISSTFSADRRTVINTYPGGVTVIQSKNQARQDESLQGSGVVPEYYSHTYNVDGHSGVGGPDETRYLNCAVKTTYKGNLGSPRWQMEERDYLNNIDWKEWPISTTVTNVGWLWFDFYTDVFSHNNPYQPSQVISSTGESIFYDYGIFGETNLVGVNMAWPYDSNHAYGRIHFTGKEIIQLGDIAYEATTNYTWLTDYSEEMSVQSAHLEQLNGFTGSEVARTMDYDADNNETITTTYLDRETDKITTVISEPATSSLCATNVYQNGRPISASTLSVASPTVYKYDDLGRTNQIISPLGYSAYINYDPVTGWVINQTDFTGQTTSYQYYGPTEANAGKLKCQTSANGKKTYYAYTDRGELHYTWGDVPYPAEYRYNEYGDLTNLITFRGGSSWTGSSWPGSSGGDNTYWKYDEASGALLQKKDAQGNAVNYTYDTITGRLFTRSWARLNGTNSVTVTNSYNGFGDLTAQEYNDGTPNVYLNSYNRAGQPRQIIDGSGTTVLTYDQASRLVTSHSSDGLMAGITVSNHFNPYYGRDAVAVLGLNSPLEDDFTYESSSGRLSSVGSGACLAVYGYAPNSDLLQTTTFKNSGDTVLTTTRTWDYGMRLRSIANVVDSAPVTSHSYQYDTLNRRTQATLEDGSYWSYGYDDRDELISAKRNWSYFATTTPVSGQQFGYAYDNIGNRQTATFGGDTNGANLRTIIYTNNSLNQYIGILTPTYANIIGAALATNGVTVNNGAADRHGEYFHREITVANGSNPVWQNVTNISGTFTNKGGLLVPASSQVLTYDADGNLSSDSIWIYQWDAENRLISMTMTNNVAWIAASNRLKLDFAYDFMGRRIQKIVSVWNVATNDYVPSTTNRFVYNGWNLLAIINPQSSIFQSFMWGKDLSGTTTNAGGVGGLLMATISGTNYFAGYGGSGNITALINTVDKSTGARYEYSPYGELIRATGLCAHQNPFRFSTKFWDDETGLIYYNYRYYNPIIGKWIGRDRLKDKPILHLYLFCHNNPLNRFDTDGRDDLPECLIALNCASSLDAAYSGATPFIADGVMQLIASLGPALNSATAYACAYAATAGILLCNNENLIFDASSLTLGFATHPGPGMPGVGDEFYFSAGELLYEMAELEQDPSAAYGMGSAEVDYITGSNSQ